MGMGSIEIKEFFENWSQKLFFSAGFFQTEKEKLKKKYFVGEYYPRNHLKKIICAESFLKKSLL